MNSHGIGGLSWVDLAATGWLYLSLEGRSIYKNEWWLKGAIDCPACNVAPGRCGAFTIDREGTVYKCEVGAIGPYLTLLGGHMKRFPDSFGNVSIAFNTDTWVENPVVAPQSR
jgi:hypothetical protein